MEIHPCHSPPHHSPGVLRPPQRPGLKWTCMSVTPRCHTTDFLPSCPCLHALSSPFLHTCRVIFPAEAPAAAAPTLPPPPRSSRLPGQRYLFLITHIALSHAAHSLSTPCGIRILPALSCHHTIGLHPCSLSAACPLCDVTPRLTCHQLSHHLTLGSKFCQAPPENQSLVCLTHWRGASLLVAACHPTSGVVRS